MLACSVLHGLSMGFDTANVSVSSVAPVPLQEKVPARWPWAAAPDAVTPRATIVTPVRRTVLQTRPTAGKPHSFPLLQRLCRDVAVIRFPFGSPSSLRTMDTDPAFLEPLPPPSYLAQMTINGFVVECNLEGRATDTTLGAVDGNSVERPPGRTTPPGDGARRT